MTDEDKIKPIKLFAYLYFMGIYLLCLFIPFTGRNERYDDPFYIFCYIVSFIHLIIGVGLISRKKWGFTIFKYYLTYFLRLGYPIGSVIANKMLAYIAENNVEESYAKNSDHKK